VLYLRRGGFYCRKCAQVSYRSQSEDAIGRAWRRQQKTEAKLGPDGERPKWMRQQTYDRLCRIADEAGAVRDERVAMYLIRRWPDSL